jgi:PAS domain S-box-containing protein
MAARHRPAVTDGHLGADSLLEDAPCGFVAFTDDGTVRVVNRTLLEMLGLAREAVVGHHVETMLTVGSRIFYQTHLFPLLRLQGRADEIFLLLRTAAGAEVGALLNAVRREHDGDAVTHCVVMRVQERQRFEDALLRAKREAESAQATSEASRAELQAANALLEQQAMELETSQQQLNEQTEQLEVRGQELEAMNDELLERSLELERQRSIADEANHAKSAFLAAMSHELRTPLNAIGGYVQLLEMGIHGPVTAAQTDALGKVARSQRHLLRLINEVLNLAKIEAGSVHYELQRVVLREIVDDVLPMVEPQLTERGLSCELDVPVELAVRADRDKAEQVLLNLLGNAVKFTPRGGRVRVAACRDATSPQRMLLRVEDTGVGIPADRLEQVFEPFVQVNVDPARRAEGTGLGLAISRDLARGMGGGLTATSVVGEGSTFTLELPAA